MRDFRDSIPSRVICVHRASLTIAGELRLRTATHREYVPKTLTFNPVDRFVAAMSLVGQT